MRNRDLARLKHIRTLDPATDYEEIYRTVAQYEFGWETMLGLNLGDSIGRSGFRRSPSCCSRPGR